jgi:formylglycine-generating enzyme required for sulfatase activity
VVNVFAQITALEPDHPDPDGLLASAREELEAERRRARVHNLYRRAGQALDAGQWAEARQLLRQVQEQEPGYRNTERLLAKIEQIRTLDPQFVDPEEIAAKAQAELAREERRQKQLADLYAQARELCRAQRWQVVVNTFSQIATLEPKYADPEGLLAKAKAEIEQQKAQRQREEQIARLYEEARGLARTQQWRQAVSTMDKIRALDAQFPDPAGIAEWVQKEAAQEKTEAQQQSELASLYAEAVRLLQAGQYQSALDKWDQVRAQDPQYPDRDKVQATAQQKLEAPATATLPKRELSRPGPQAAQPRRAALPTWFWPAAGGVAVLLVIVVVIVAALGGGESGKATPTDAPRPTVALTEEPEPTVPVTKDPSAEQPPAVADAGDPWTRPPDSMTMLYVPAGEFTMGSADNDSDADSDEKPQRTVTLDAFWIDKTEVTNAQFRKCVEAGACQAPTTCAQGDPTYDDGSKADHPVVCVDWNQAKAYCEWTGARLPTEAEWEKAARGTDGRIYPWGNTFDGSKVNFCDRNCEFDHKDTDVDDGYARTAPVGSYPAGASPYGALDMAGNIWEWVADWYDGSYYVDSTINNPKGPDSGDYRVLRGGSWYNGWHAVRAADRSHYGPTLRHYSVGFRCAGSPGE